MRERHASAQPARPAVRPDWRAERRFWREGFGRVAGVDEVGRGPLAGPVAAGVVVLPFSRAAWVGRLRDSKQLSAAVREELAERIRAQGEWGVGLVSPQVIDQIGIGRATRLAMRRAVESLARRAAPPDALLVDGREVVEWPVGGVRITQRSIVGGDARCVSVAAASIVAKVARDTLMRELDGRFPGYGLARHKGYGTAVHLRALRDHGATMVHRRSFRPVREALRR